MKTDEMWTGEDLRKAASRAELLHAFDTIVRRFAERVKALERELSALREEAARYKGIWRHGETYALGDMATDRGQLWYCRSEEPTDTRPGSGPAWQLTSKRR